MIEKISKLYINVLYFDNTKLYKLSDNSFRVLFFNFNESDFSILKSVRSQKLNTTDTIYFSKSVKYPKLLLNQLNIKNKRTTNKDKADKIIVDELEKYSIDKSTLESGYLVVVDEDYYLFASDDIFKYVSFEEFDKFVPGEKIRGYIQHDISLNINTFNDIFNYASDINKLVSFEDFAKCVNHQLPKITDDYKKTCLSMIESSDIEQQKLGINILITYDLSDCLVELLNILLKSKFQQFKTKSVQIDYLKHLLKINSIIRVTYNRNMIQHYLSDIYNKKYLSWISKDQYNLIPLMFKNVSLYNDDDYLQQNISNSSIDNYDWDYYTRLCKSLNMIII